MSTTFDEKIDADLARIVSELPENNFDELFKTLLSDFDATLASLPEDDFDKVFASLREDD